SAERAAGIEDLTDAVPTARWVVTETDEWRALATEPVVDGAGDPYPTSLDSPGFWLCTSGSTGRPKLAMHRHADLQISADLYGRGVLGIAADDRFYSVGPMFHAYGLGNSLTFPMAVGAVASLEPTRPPTPARVAETVRTEQPTLFFAIPTFFA